MTTTTVTPNNNTDSFEVFLHGWQHQQDQLLSEITAALCSDEGDDDEVAKELVGRALIHFQEYYIQKSRATQHNVFSLFSPSSSSYYSLESPFMWITGFRPSILLQLVSDSVLNLTSSQIQAIHRTQFSDIQSMRNRLKKEIRKDERQISDKLAKIQEKAAAPPIIHGLRNGTWSTDDEPCFKPTTNEPLEQLQMAFEEVVANADSLRVTTSANVAEILIPTQGLRFLAAAFRLQQSMRRVQIKSNNYGSRDGY